MFFIYFVMYWKHIVTEKHHEKAKKQSIYVLYCYMYNAYVLYNSRM